MDVFSIGKNLEKDYQLDCQIDFNKTGASVYRAWKKCSKSKQFVIKILPKKDCGRYRWSREVELFKKCSHPNIVTLIEIIDDKEHAYLVMEAMNCNLYTFISTRGKLSNKLIKKCIRDIARAMLYCHQQGIVFCDLKLENILVNIDEHNQITQFKLCDFGWAHNVGDKISLCGTLDYLSPEMFAEHAGVEHDSWTLGIVCYELLRGSPPFEAACRDETYLLIMDHSPNLQGLEFNTADFICRLLDKNPQTRMTLEDALSHPYIKNYPGFLAACCQE